MILVFVNKKDEEESSIVSDDIFYCFSTTGRGEIYDV